MTTERLRPFAIPPGETIKEQMASQHISQKDFAAHMGMSLKRLNNLINGDVPITQEVAIRLEMILGVPATFWIRLEKIYRVKLLKYYKEG